MRPSTQAIRVSVAVVVASVLGVLVPTSLAAPLQMQTGGKVKVRIVGANNGKDVTNGGVAGKGNFIASGAIADSGAVVVYRTVKGNLTTGNAVITLRDVAMGKKGKITFLVKVVIKPTTTTSRWTIESGTKAYKGLHGQGKEYENSDHTLQVLVGTVSLVRA